MSPLDRVTKTIHQREQRAEAAIAAGRTPHVTGRPATGRRAPKQHGDRAGQRQRARLRLVQSRGDNGTPATAHPLLELARSIAARFRRPDGRALLHRPVHEDATGAAALALVAGEDAEAAARSVVREDDDWLHHTAPLAEHGWLTLLEDQEAPLVAIGKRP